MSDLNWALLMAAVAIIQSIRAEWHARSAIGYKEAAQNKYNEGYLQGRRDSKEQAEGDQAGWMAEAVEYRELIIDIIRKAVMPKESEDE